MSARITPLNGARRPLARPMPELDALRPAVVARAKQRAGDEAAEWTAQRVRLDAAIQGAHQSGFEAGQREGYILGVKWGMTCGVVAGALTVGCIWVISTPALAHLTKWVL